MKLRYCPFLDKRKPMHIIIPNSQESNEKLELFSDCFATKPAAQVDEKKILVDGSYRCKWITLKLFPFQLPYARKTNQPTITNIDIHRHIQRTRARISKRKQNCKRIGQTNSWEVPKSARHRTRQPRMRHQGMPPEVPHRPTRHLRSC